MTVDPKHIWTPDGQGDDPAPADRAEAKYWLRRLHRIRRRMRWRRHGREHFFIQLGEGNYSNLTDEANSRAFVTGNLINFDVSDNDFDRPTLIHELTHAKDIIGIFHGLQIPPKRAAGEPPEALCFVGFAVSDGDMNILRSRPHRVSSGLNAPPKIPYCAQTIREQQASVQVPSTC